MSGSSLKNYLAQFLSVYFLIWEIVYLNVTSAVNAIPAKTPLKLPFFQHKSH